MARPDTSIPAGGEAEEEVHPRHTLADLTPDAWSTVGSHLNDAEMGRLLLVSRQVRGALEHNSALFGDLYRHRWPQRVAAAGDQGEPWCDPPRRYKECALACRQVTGGRGRRGGLCTEHFVSLSVHWST